MCPVLIETSCQITSKDCFWTAETGFMEHSSLIDLLFTNYINSIEPNEAGSFSNSWLLLMINKDVAAFSASSFDRPAQLQGLA